MQWIRAFYPDVAGVECISSVQPNQELRCGEPRLQPEGKFERKYWDLD